jgi:hypothetical protein
VAVTAATAARAAATAAADVAATAVVAAATAAVSFRRRFAPVSVFSLRWVVRGFAGDRCELCTRRSLIHMLACGDCG